MKVIDDGKRTGQKTGTSVCLDVMLFFWEGRRNGPRPAPSVSLRPSWSDIPGEGAQAASLAGPFSAVLPSCETHHTPEDMLGGRGGGWESSCLSESHSEQPAVTL